MLNRRDKEIVPATSLATSDTSLGWDLGTGVRRRPEERGGLASAPTDAAAWKPGGKNRVASCASYIHAD